ncbi:anti-sigma factor family protein [Streptomyces ardesiacus]|uniref:anti-sigma factor family protein n=1 Tax=Streptomyces ardesiacus TaxID=285564 RepID=UPI0006E21FFC|nr:anti-sigma factor [Streptomyces sp. NBRC 110030]
MRVLHAYLDGETDQTTARRVMAHLEGCRDCGLEADRYGEIKNSLTRRDQPDAWAVADLRSLGESLLRIGPADWRGRMPGG